MVLDLRIASDLELESRCRIIDHLDLVLPTDRIESIDTIRRHSGSVEQRSNAIERELHAELHCSSVNDIDAISAIDDLVWISVIDIDEDDIDLEQWRRIAERVSIRIALDGIVVLDLVRISSDLELESRIRIIDHHVDVYRTAGCPRTIHRHSGSVEQRSCSIERELHAELYAVLLIESCSRIFGLYPSTGAHSFEWRSDGHQL